MQAERFMCFVPLKANGLLTADALVQRVQARFGGKVPMDIKPAGDPSQPGAVLVDIEGVLLTIMNIDQPLPPDAYAPALEIERVWKNAGAELAANVGHVIISTLQEPGHHNEALNGAVYVTFFAAAVMDILPTIGAVWTNGNCLTQTAAFQAAAEGLAERNIPVMSWVGLYILRGPDTADGQPTIAVLTRGLLSFIGREIEFLPTTRPVPDTAQRVIGLSQYLISSGPVIQDGETVGVSEQEQIRVKYAAQGQMGVPVMMLEE